VLAGADTNRLSVRAAALLVFFAGTTGTRIVASDFRAAANHLLDLLIAGTGHSSLFQFTAFPALERFFEVVD
jgi:hypothetical protein